MKVKMLVSIAGHACPITGFTRDFAFAPGDTPVLKPELAKAWIANGFAELEKPAEKKAEKK